MPALGGEGAGHRGGDCGVLAGGGQLHLHLAGGAGGPRGEGVLPNLHKMVSSVKEVNKLAKLKSASFYPYPI